MASQLTHKQTDKLSSQCYHIQLIKGNVEQWQETIKTLKENPLDNEGILPFSNRSIEIDQHVAVE